KRTSPHQRHHPAKQPKQIHEIPTQSIELVLMVDYVFDGSFGGLLTAVFEAFERKHLKIRLLLQGQTPNVFGEVFNILPNPDKAGRVWKGLQKKAGDIGHTNYYKAFLS